MGSSSTTTQNNSPYAPAQPGIDAGLADAQSLYENGGYQVTPYQGNMVAGQDPLTQQSYAMAGNVAQQNISNNSASADFLTNTMNAGVPDAVRQNVIAGIMPAINSSFAKSGMTGSTLHQQNLTKGLSSGLADVEDQYMQRGMNAASMLPSVGGANNSQIDWLNSVGQGQQGYEQNLINADMLVDQQAQTAETDALQNYLALVTGAGSQFGVQSSTTDQNMGIGGLLGAGMQMIPFLSDRRAKEDIRRVGQTDGGLPVYTYRYKGDNTYQMGVMAQEVEAVNPDAVATLSNGLKAVYYSEVR